MLIMTKTKTNTTTITQKGQVTIPKEIREYLGLKTKNQVEFRIEKGKVVIKPTSHRGNVFLGEMRSGNQKQLQIHQNENSHRNTNVHFWVVRILS